MSTLLIAEHEGHVEALRSSVLLKQPATEVLAVTAGADLALARLGITSLKPEDFCSDQEVNQAGEWVEGMLPLLERHWTSADCRL